MKKLSSQQLQKFNEGDEQVFNDVYCLFYRQLFFYACKFHISPWESEDLVSEAFVSLYRQVGLGNRFESVSHMANFLFLVIRKAAISHTHAPQRAYRYKKNFLQFAGGQEDDVCNARIEAETLQIIYDAIEGLPPVCRKVFKMSYLQDLNYHEIARRLKLSPQTVMNQESRAVKLLRKRILTSASPLVTGLFAGSLAAMLFLSLPRQPVSYGGNRLVSKSVSLLCRCIFSCLLLFFS